VTLVALGEGLLNSGDAAAAEAVFRPAQRQHPGDLALSLALGQTLIKVSRRSEAIRYFMMARAIRPESGHVLAHALQQKGESAEAIEVFRDLIPLRHGPSQPGHRPRSSGLSG
jgi:predicted Zn-dependent protease